MTGNLNTFKELQSEFKPIIAELRPDQVTAFAFDCHRDGLEARIVRGSRMRSRQGLFDEFSAAFQFPLYFGNNFDAFEECLSDLEGIPPREGLVLIVAEWEQVLQDADPRAFATFLQILRSASKTWQTPIAAGEWWDREAVPFHVVLAGSSSEPSALSRWFETP